MKRISILVFSVLILASTAFAQSFPNAIQEIDLTLSNESPGPGETIVVKAQSYVADLNSANISWTLNGASFQKGVGLTSIQVQAPLLGKKLTIGINAVTSDGRSMSYSMTLGSGSIDLILETDGYLPPFFEGKFPLVYQNSYKIVAMPQLANSAGKIYDPQTLVYEWTKDSKVISEQSGYGKQVFTWKDEMVPRQRSISVRVSTRDGSTQAEKSIIVEPSSPKITFYRDDPLYGPIYNAALDSLVGLGRSGEVSVLAVPYGFNKPATGAGSLSFTWLVNMAKQTALEASQSITLRAPGDATGTSDITLQIKNSNEILQSSQNGFTASFTKTDAVSTVNTPNANGI